MEREEPNKLREVDQTVYNTVDGFGKAESEINSEWEARTCAGKIFKNVAKPGAK